MCQVNLCSFKLHYPVCRCFFNSTLVASCESTFIESKFLAYDWLFLDAEWTLYEQVAIAAMDCHCLDVAQVLI